MSNPVELLRRALDALIAQDETIYAEFCGSQNWRSPPIIEEIRAFLGENNIPLYTISKPTRKPMKIEEIGEAWEARGNLSKAGLVSFARAIEKHHKIGDEE